ncbi:MAG: protein-L-isoaspartate(D-aspartate) O-methyltransferase, partial [Anaerolineales bacterium]|nr:protein-L-isoaspartate(D-aspartate) O-methyltransferase [Anaerolineales bacterium]
RAGRIRTAMRLGILLATGALPPALALLAANALLAACAEVPVPSLTDTPLASDPFAAVRDELVETGIIGYGIEDPAVIQAIRSVPRHRFVPAEYRDKAYGNHPLPIGYGQTISQPYIVALMTEALELKPGDRVLEIGTGSGYQAAVLLEMGMEVYSIEIVGPLADSAATILEQPGYPNLNLKHADGYFGWEQAAPFDAIIVTAAPDHVPRPLLRQLKVGGILVIPVGPVGGFQELWSVRRTGAEDYENASLGGVRFVPLVREPGPE